MHYLLYDKHQTQIGTNLCSDQTKYDISLVSAQTALSIKYKQTNRRLKDKNTYRHRSKNNHLLLKTSVNLTKIQKFPKINMSIF